MSEFQLTHIALVGARIASFKALGFNTRNELALRRAAPAAPDSLAALEDAELRTTLQNQFPLWIHNIIADPDFPSRHKLEGPLRRFEGELKDSKHDEVVSTVLSKGFKNQQFDPFDPPKSMPMRQRCAMVVNIGVWQEAYRKLEEDVIAVLMANRDAVSRWLDRARRPEFAAIEEE